MTRLAMLALFSAAALNAHHLAWWCLPLLAVACGLHLRATLQGLPLPGRLARTGLAVLITAGVLLSFRTLNGLAAGATLLAAMSAAKLFEARSPRDWYVICGATLFLLLAACLDRQQIWRLPLYAACLFLLFPRLPGGFWSLPGDEAAITGLSDEMSPGDIARLTESDAPALRARFAGALPPAIERYWRGPVLHDFDGYTWRRRNGPGAVRQPPLAASAIAVRRRAPTPWSIAAPPMPTVRRSSRIRTARSWRWKCRARRRCHSSTPATISSCCRVGR